MDNSTYVLCGLTGSEPGQGNTYLGLIFIGIPFEIDSDRVAMKKQRCQVVLQSAYISL